MKDKLLKNKMLLAYMQIFFGCLVGACAYPLFLVPNNVAPGGVTGVATIINFVFGTPVGTVSFILNVPLFILAYASLGRQFFIRSIIATFVFSIFIDILPFKPITDNLLLASIYGGITLGFGLGLILRGGATTGGTDLIARIINSKIKFVSIGMILFVCDLCVITAAGIVMGAELALYAIINIFVVSFILDITMQGLNRCKACYIISNKPEQTRESLMKGLSRGTTIIHATGGYTMQEKPILLCIVNPRETFVVKNIVQEVDSKAFMFITEAHEVLGEGFKELGK